MKRLTVLQGDITAMDVDAIVSAANTSLLGGGGVDGAIHRAAGPELLAECETLGGAAVGEAKLTNGYGLPAKYVIHTPGPIYKKYDKSTAAVLLASCYRESLKLADRVGARTIAFPAISTGVYGYPKHEAAEIAIRTVTQYLKTRSSGIEQVTFAAFSQEDYRVYVTTLAPGDFK